MTAFTPPVLQIVQPRFREESTPLQKRLYRYMRPLDQPVNVFVLSDHTVLTDYSVPILPTSENGEATVSSVGFPAPWMPNESVEGPREGAEGGPFRQPPPYATVTNWNLEVDQFSLDLWIEYWFRGGCTYPSISANLVTILTNAGYAEYLT
jgi:hypothetical protein